MQLVLPGQPSGIQYMSTLTRLPKLMKTLRRGGGSLVPPIYCFTRKITVALPRPTTALASQMGHKTWILKQGPQFDSRSFLWYSIGKSNYGYMRLVKHSKQAFVFKVWKPQTSYFSNDYFTGSPGGSAIALTSFADCFLKFTILQSFWGKIWLAFRVRWIFVSQKRSEMYPAEIVSPEGGC